MFKFLMLFLLSLSSYGAVTVKATHHVVEAYSSFDQKHNVNVYTYKNAWGRPEVKLVSAYAPRSVTGSFNPVFGYGRDLDDDGLIDTWFMNNTHDGYTTYSMEGAHPWGFDIIEKELFKYYSSQTEMYMGALASSVLGVLSMAVSHSWEETLAFDQRRLDLEEIRLRLEKTQSLNLNYLTKAQIAATNQYIAEGYRRSYERYFKATSSEYWTLAAADLALIVSGGWFLKFFGKGLQFSGRAVIDSPLMKRVNLIFQKRLAYLKKVTPVLPGQAVRALTEKALTKAIDRTGLALIAKSRLGLSLKPVVNRFALAAKKVKDEWKFVAMGMGISTATTLNAHWDEVYNANPLIMAKNIFSNKDIMQNTAYMGSQAIALTGVNGAFKKNASKLIAGGFISLANSSAMNFLIMKNDNYERIALDTGWQMAVNNLQTLGELQAISFFEKMSVKKNIPGLKLAGYVLMIFDSIIIDSTYNQAAKIIEKRNEAQGVLVPVMLQTH